MRRRSAAAAEAHAPAAPGPASAIRARLEALDPMHAALGLMLLHLALLAAVFDPTIFTGGDNGVYVALSRSLVELGAYLSIHEPVAYPHTYYPPGYPVILAIGRLLGIEPWVPIKWITVAFSVAGVGLAYLYLRRRSAPGVALFVGLVVAMAPGLLALGHTELSDVPFWSLLMLSLWALEATPREARGRVALAALAMAAGYLTRTAALPLVLGATGWLLLERRWRQAAIFAAIVLPAMGGWAWWTAAHAEGNVYGNQFTYLDPYQPELGRAGPADILARIPENARVYAGIMLPLLLRAERGPLAFGALLLALAFVGWALRLRRRGLGELLFPLYGGMLFVLPPPWAGERYVLPILPLALAYVAEAVLWPLRRAAPAVRTPAVAFAGALLVLVAAFGVARRSAEAADCRRLHTAEAPYACLHPAWQEYLQAADWARSGLPSDAIVVSRKPGLFFALSERRGIDIPKTFETEEFFDVVEEAGARYIVLDWTDALTPTYAFPIVMGWVGSFCLVHASPSEETLLLGIRLDAPRAPTPQGTPPVVTACPDDYFAEAHAP